MRSLANLTPAWQITKRLKLETNLSLRLSAVEIYFTETLERRAWLLISRDKLESDFSQTINNTCFSKLLIVMKSPLNKGRDRLLLPERKNRSSLHSNGWTVLPHFPTKQFTLKMWTKSQQIHQRIYNKAANRTKKESPNKWPWENWMCLSVERDETLTSQHAQKSGQIKPKHQTANYSRHRRRTRADTACHGR